MLIAMLAISGALRADTTSLSGAFEITALPYVVSSPGVYYLGQNFFPTTTNVNAITVNVSGVTIDLNGHTISNLAAGKGVVDTGIYAPNVSRLTVRNGVIRGFTYGVYAPGGYGHLVEEMRFTDSTFAAVRLEANGSIIRRCQAYRVGGSTVSWAPYGVGIIFLGDDNTVQDCDISEAISSNPAAYPTQGMYFDSGSGLLVIGNRISGVQDGLYFDAGASGKYRDNLCAVSVGTPYTGGTDVGNN